MAAGPSTAVSELLARALAEPLSSRSDPTRDRVLDAALDLAAATGLRHLTMDDVAARAGVGRMTVYRRFATRAELVDALAVREAQRCLARIAAAVRPADELVERISRLFEVTLQVIAEHPLLARLARSEPEAILRELRREDSRVFSQVRGFLVAQLRAAQTTGELASGNPEPLAELAIRLGASFVLIPGGRLGSGDPAVLRRTVRQLLAARAQEP
jgi:AcrR family transcriptional regulator